MSVTTMDVKAALKEHFGFEKFKENQELIIESILAGQNTFVLMPTGGGKSLCYQLPALMMPGITLIISPLIALMKNQVDSIRGFGENDRIAHFLNSSLSKTQMKEVKDDIRSGQTKLLYIAPETLTKEENIDFFRDTDLSFVAVDEAHCISEWGHDFRPEYRRIKTMIESINKDIPVMALTATATPKVQLDIVKNLNMGENPNIFVSSFNRPNLFYDVRPKINKEKTIKEIVQILKNSPGKSGIIYVQARKTTEEIAEILNVNGIKAAAYHAGLDAKTRTRVQDDFLMEEANIIVATIAFGMGIDKPDVRFVIHYDIPKSIENYYQETGRAGRDGLQGKCIAFYSYKDIMKLEKFLRDKPVSERELSIQLMEEMIGYTETGACRREFLLHYFGEKFEVENCNNLCDNCKTPKEKIEVKDEMKIALNSLIELNENFGIKTMVNFVTGKNTKEIKDFGYESKPLFGIGKDKDELFWHSIFRQAILNNLIFKDIEQYGLLKISESGHAFLQKPFSITVPMNRDYSDSSSEDMVQVDTGKGAALDPVLMSMLKDLQVAEGRRHKVQPWVVFLEPSLQDMATYYPLTMEDMLNISGVSNGKAKRYGKPFLELIRGYVEENEIERPMDFVMKQVANKSKAKVAIIQGTDRKMPLEDIANSNNLTYDELLHEMDMIVTSGTKIDIDYYLEENFDEEVIEEIFDYFNDAKSDSISEAVKALQEDDISEEEILLARIKYMSDKAN